jgi:hypothetical protein
VLPPRLVARLHVLNLLQLHAPARRATARRPQGRAAPSLADLLKAADGIVQAPFAGVRGVRLHQRSPAGPTRWARLARRHEVVAVRLSTRWRWRCPTSAW